MEDGQKWLFKNKEHGMMSATASIGLVLLWDVDGGLTQVRHVNNLNHFDTSAIFKLHAQNHKHSFLSLTVRFEVFGCLKFSFV